MQQNKNVLKKVGYPAEFCDQFKEQLKLLTESQT